MAGHSKWANIKHKKEKSDAKKGKLFTKIGREIAVTVKQGGADPESNSKLKDVIAKAKAANMPNESIMRSIKKAAGDVDNQNYEEISYEGYGPAGVAVIVEAMTDNRNRTAGDLRHYFDKYGGNLGQSGCVSYMFDKKGVIIIERNDKTDEDEVMMEALEAGAEDFSAGEEYFEVLTEPADFSSVRQALENKGYSITSADIEMIPQTTVKLTDEEQVKQMEKLIDAVEDMDDVQDIYHNWEQD
jgi:YebC/PmpR family DNA-binding regulatory protein